MSDETPRPAQPTPPAEPASAPEVPAVPAPQEPAVDVLPVQPAAVPPPPSAYGYPGAQPYAHPAWGAPVPPVPPARRKRRTALLVAGVLVVVAAAGGGYALTRDGDGKSTPLAKPSATATPTPTRTYAVTAGGTHVGDLGQMLLPMPQGMRPGPDLEQFGNDTVLDAAGAKKLLMGGDTGSRFPSAQRRALESQIDAMHVKGAAVRTYRTADNRQTYQMVLVQVGNKTAAGAQPEAFRGLTADSKYLSKGPEVPGYPHAVCVQPTAPDDSDDSSGDDSYDDSYDDPSVDMMFCQATEGDLMVQFQAVGEGSVDWDEIPALLRRQLDRVKAPGEGV
ncbi:hypothetical protein [Streptomyces sp. NPDC021224]|uniref:hypothetical protein n=1 Tax=unclassified Streptomyces TaxID=2593676 RepID=UPI0037B955AC